MADHFTRTLASDSTPSPSSTSPAASASCETEIAPAWWARPTEIGETSSATVAMTFCDKQNAVTLDRNRAKRHRYYADPIYATDSDPDVDEALRRARAPRTAVAAR
ncbi:hypothetical protein [Streptomyces microflavus]|uniref:hypothetical protein n=1 Tax=Streptomyces microflavus TaxID=1919 RepID=UPI003B222DB1